MPTVRGIKAEVVEDERAKSVPVIIRLVNNIVKMIGREETGFAVRECEKRCVEEKAYREKILRV